MKYPTELIDWQLLSQANSFYKNYGFIQVETPFAIPNYYHSFTKPHNNQSFVLDKDMFSNEPHELVGSAEQGFIYLLLNDLISNNKLQSITPCFRFDDYDQFHQPWFLKLELFHLSENIDDLEINNIEIGSYGFRHINNLTFIYGTGLALPRFSLANKK